MAFIIFSGHMSFAVCDKAVTRLIEGTPALCTGYLFTPEKELEVRIKDATYTQMEDLVKKNQELNEILYKRVDNLQELNLKLNDKIQANQTQDFWVKFAYFGLGVLVTGMIAREVGK
jgi:hypothetical protein